MIRTISFHSTFCILISVSLPSFIDLVSYLCSWIVLRFQNFFSGIPLLYIQYAAIWRFLNVIPKTCANITIRLNNSKSTTEEAFSNACKYVHQNSTVHFTYETLAFTVRNPSWIRIICILRYKNEMQTIARNINLRSNLFW